MIRPKQNGASYGYADDVKGVDAVTDSAAEVVPLLMQRFNPSSVLDLGCGAGDWLNQFHQQGVRSILGYDGTWVPPASLKISQDCFQAIDFYAPLPGVKRFDLAMCLEVAEHVSEEVGKKMVSFLCRSADLVFFSAAISGQDGYEHINEHFQDYWVARFQEHGFSAFDIIRPVIWENPSVSFWYRQNCLVYANDAGILKYGLEYAPFIASMVHPEMYNRTRDPRTFPTKAMVSHVPHYLSRFLKSRLPGAKSQ